MRKVLSALIILIALSPLSGFSEERIKMGISCALSGRYAPLAKVYLAGWETYLKKVNKMGGIEGKKLQWRVLDDKYDPKRAVQNTKKLINWGAKILAGYVGIDTTREVISYLEEEDVKVPFFFPMTSSRFIRTNIQGQLYSIRPYINSEIALILDHMILNKKMFKWGVFYSDDYTGLAGKYMVERYLADYNLSLAYELSYDGDPKKLTIGNIKEKRPDAIVIIADAVLARAFIKKVGKAFGKTEMPVVIAVSSVFPCSYIRKVAKYVGPSKFWFTQVTPYPKDTSYTIVEEYLKDLKKFSLGEKPCFVSLEGYIAAKVLCDILARAGSTALPAIEASAENTDIDIGLGKNIVFNKVIHRSPIGIGLYELIDKKPTINTVLWDDLSHRTRKMHTEAKLSGGGAGKKDISVDVKINKVEAKVEKPAKISDTKVNEAESKPAEKSGPTLPVAE